MTKVSSSNESGGMPNSNMNEKGNNMSEPPSKPDNESDGNMSEPPSMPNGENKDMSMPNNTSKSVDTKYYIAFGIEGLVIGFIVILLIITKFNSISFSEIFTSSDKTIIFILSTIILTALFTFGFIFITNKCFLNSDSNGGNVTLNLNNQEAIGNIVVDSISTLTLLLKNGSYIEGSVNSDNTAKNIVLNIDKDSKIKLTGDMYVSELNNDDVTNSNIDLNGYKLYVNNVEIK